MYIRLVVDGGSPITVGEIQPTLENFKGVEDLFTKQGFLIPGGDDRQGDDVFAILCVEDGEIYLDVISDLRSIFE